MLLQERQPGNDSDLEAPEWSRTKLEIRPGQDQIRSELSGKIPLKYHFYSYVCLYFLSLQIVFEGVWGNNRVSGYLALDDVTFFDGDCDSKNFKHFIKASRRKMGSLPIKIQACCTNN